MIHQDMIHLALEAAGGRIAVAEYMELKVDTVRNWARNKSIPPEYILPICKRGNFIISCDQVLAYIENEHKKESGNGQIPESIA